jgi:hypothetical protein
MYGCVMRASEISSLTNIDRAFSGVVLCCRAEIGVNENVF